MPTTTYRSTITADQSLQFGDSATYTPDDGASLAGSVSGTTFSTFWDYNTTYRVNEAFFGFDLTSPTSGDAPSAGATITSVTLNMYLIEHGSVARTKEVYAYDWGAEVGTGDWRTVAQLQALYDSGDGVVASYAIPSGWGGNEGNHDFTTGDGAAAAVSAAIGGTLRLLMADAAHRAGSTPTARGYCSWASANHGTESYRPLLTVEWTAGAGVTAAYPGRGIGRGIVRGIMR